MAYGSNLETIIKDMSYAFDPAIHERRKNSYGNYEIQLNASQLDIGGSQITPSPIETKYFAAIFFENLHAIGLEIERLCDLDEDCRGALVSFPTAFNYVAEHY
mmetsp:Transcript_42431/g.65106  ORF Transcript_42431/g.65106 Transcript_42431/m.65106 type:complete len:103 (-) Transcript_42431:84-392(-)|eukprot:CAMPEP_0170506944 /NCGR_PEP_ID=MMETSP0208-20121228/56995_1 /TAXON_ID=197538 /ORGANISM="Strombidium inclinatum, Strain S3" /LENGTH=102 /DNA_ID=CAMNT_0010788827 /DNA_START=394 /DNA_END=702 /DNA_ORIENTATION=-